MDDFSGSPTRIVDQPEKLHYLVEIRGDQRPVLAAHKIKSKAELAEFLGYANSAQTAARWYSGNPPNLKMTEPLPPRRWDAVCEIYVCDRVSFIQDKFATFKAKSEAAKPPAAPLEADFVEILGKAQVGHLGHLYHKNPHRLDGPGDHQGLRHGCIGEPNEPEPIAVLPGQPIWFEFSSQPTPDGRRNQWGRWHILLVEMDPNGSIACFVPITKAPGWNIQEFPTTRRLILPQSDAIASGPNHTLFTVSVSDRGRTMTVYLVASKDPYPNGLIAKMAKTQSYQSSVYRQLAGWLEPRVNAGTVGVEGLRYHVVNN